jgi:hypothetical protein
LPLGSSVSVDVRSISLNVRFIANDFALFPFPGILFEMNNARLTDLPPPRKKVSERPHWYGKRNWTTSSAASCLALLFAGLGPPVVFDRLVGRSGQVRREQSPFARVVGVLDSMALRMPLALLFPGQ